MVYTRSIALVMTLLGAVSALPAAPFVPESDLEFADIAARKAAPSGWENWGFEDYNVYHDRYNALGCKYKHDTTFFTQCCGPLKNGKTLASRPAQCNPANLSANSTSTVVAAAATTSVATVPTTSVTATVLPDNVAVDGGDDECEEDDGADTTEDDSSDDDSVTSSVAAATSTTKTTKTSASATSTAAAATGTGQVYTGGYATFYSQGGNAGACGKVHSDSDLIGAIDSARWGKKSFGIKSDLCGRKVKITNPKNNKSVTISIEDVCPTCENENSIDLSEGAFTKIATKKEGMVKIEWQFV